MAIDWDKCLLGPVVGVFGEKVMYTPAGGVAFPIWAVYDEANKDLSLAGGMGVNTSSPIVSGRVAEFLTPPKQGDTLMIVRTGDVFVVSDPDLDGHGSFKLELNYIGP
jgi:hypothetical protein